MKIKAILGILVFLLVVPAYTIAQSWHSTNQVTVAWDPVTLPDGAPGALTYDVYTVPATADKVDAVKVTRVASPQATITFSTEGRFFLGVQSVRIITLGEELVSEITWSEEIVSEITWSDVPAGTANQPFGVVYYAAPPAATNLHMN